MTRLPIHRVLLLTIVATVTVAEAEVATLTTADEPMTEPTTTVFNTRGILFPTARYVSWESLDDDIKQDATNYLGYSNITWNIMGTANIEGLSYWTIQNTSITNPHPIDILAGMGMTNESSWDCYVNHYGDYDWEEIVLWDPEAIINGYGKLGWNISSWNGLIPYPDSENKEWNQLTPEEQQGAIEVCYFEESWQGIPLNRNYRQVVSEEVGVSSGGEVKEESWGHYYADLAVELEVLEEIVEQELAEHEQDGSSNHNNDPLAIVISNVDGVVGATGEEDPVEVTVITPSTVATAPTTEDATVTDAVVVTTPDHHYYEDHDWDELPSQVQEAASVLGYDQNNWETDSVIPEIEDLWWNQLSSEQQDAATVIGYTEESWNEDDTPSTVAPQILLDSYNNTNYYNMTNSTFDFDEDEDMDYPVANHLRSGRNSNQAIDAINVMGDKKDSESALSSSASSTYNYNSMIMTSIKTTTTTTSLVFMFLSYWC